jgi:hypothetical protein
MFNFASQAETAEWMGCTVDAMNAEHDGLHARLTDWLDAPSYSLREANGEVLEGADAKIAGAEEAAVLVLQRYIWTLRNNGLEVVP